MLSSHYRSRVNFSMNRKDEARSAIKRIKEFESRLLDITNEKSNELPKAVKLFNQHLCDDLDTPNALAEFYNWIRLTNQQIDHKNLSLDEAAQANAFIFYFNSIFDILSPNDNVPEEIMGLVQMREKHRSNKEWEKSDLLRDDLLSKGWLLKDTPNGPKLTKI